jgi:hypothetical protein
MGAQATSVVRLTPSGVVPKIELAILGGRRFRKGREIFKGTARSRKSLIGMEFMETASVITSSRAPALLIDNNLVFEDSSEWDEEHSVR